ncbi:hypothetical protein SH449x_000407 [Pirellulaceae bacterium SH449]
MDLRFFVKITTLAVVCCTLVGCRLEQDDDHDEDGHFPPHWPKTFLVAADRLSQIAQNTDETKTAADSLEQELVDLIDWLPELVADSDVSQADFDSVDAWAFPLAGELKRAMGSGKKIDEMLRTDALQSGIKQLAELAARVRAQIAEEEARERQEAEKARLLEESDSNPTVDAASFS